MLRPLRWLGYVFLARVLRLWYVLRDERTPTWAKGLVWGMLGYIAWPLDLMPDVAPVVGWADDLVAIIAAGLTLQWYSLGAITRRAKARAREIVGLEPEPDLEALEQPEPRSVE